MRNPVCVVKSGDQHRKREGKAYPAEVCASRMWDDLVEFEAALNLHIHACEGKDKARLMKQRDKWNLPRMLRDINEMLMLSNERSF